MTTVIGGSWRLRRAQREFNNEEGGSPPITSYGNLDFSRTSQSGLLAALRGF